MGRSSKQRAAGAAANGPTDVSVPLSSGACRRFQRQHALRACHSADASSGIDPAGQVAHWWQAAVSAAVLYNLWLPLFRLAFAEIDAATASVWLTLDYSADLLYLLDIWVCLRTGYLDDGVLQLDAAKVRRRYLGSGKFYADCLCLLPLDCLYLSFGFNSALRALRLCKVYRLAQFLDRIERHSSHPNAVRLAKLLHHLLLLIHFNACLLKLLAVVSPDTVAAGGDWKLPLSNSTGVAEQYLFSLYWSSLAVALMADMPRPVGAAQFAFVIGEVVAGLLLFATVLGHVAAIVADAGRARREFQAHLDGVKVYMTRRRVPQALQSKVIRWFDYLWHSGNTTEEERVLSILPDKLKAEIAIHVHLDTLKKVEMFQNTEEGFLSELVLLLQPVLFSPGDYVCRKGEVGKHMYIVSRGRLQVVADDDGKKVLATLSPGSYFGEISVLNMGRMGNRRTASVRSVGYSDLFCLSRSDLWEVLKDYPTARVKLEAVAVRRLRAFERRPMEEALRSRSFSSPGLVESSGQEPISTGAKAASGLKSARSDVKFK